MPSRGSDQQKRMDRARELMDDFVVRTGATGDGEPRRYLWTDAFAVCTLRALASNLDEPRYRELARELIDQVHFVLGRHRSDDVRKGWISGLDEHTGGQHPTVGGLRIGKPLAERTPDDTVDERLEWNRDGQYFHYLTKWVHALDRATHDTGEKSLRRWSRELLETAADRFIVESHGTLRMVWKMSIDLSRPLVASMGHHDPLDGHVRCLQLQSSGVAAGDREAADRMRTLAARFASMIHRDALATADPLGIGGLLTDAAVLAQLIDGEHIEDNGLLDALLSVVTGSLRQYARQNDLDLPATHRLAFRELGLCIGLHGVPIIQRQVEAAPNRFDDAAQIGRRLERLVEAAALRREIEAFWLTPAHRQTDLWSDHGDINDVMLATALVPDGFLQC